MQPFLLPQSRWHGGNRSPATGPLVLPSPPSGVTAEQSPCIDGGGRAFSGGDNLPLPIAVVMRLNVGGDVVMRPLNDDPIAKTEKVELHLPGSVAPCLGLSDPGLPRAIWA
jgi:hypothetical protein